MTLHLKMSQFNEEKCHGGSVEGKRLKLLPWTLPCGVALSVPGLFFSLSSFGQFELSSSYNTAVKYNLYRSTSVVCFIPQVLSTQWTFWITCRLGACSRKILWQKWPRWRVLIFQAVLHIWLASPPPSNQHLTLMILKTSPSYPSTPTAQLCC